MGPPKGIDCLETAPGGPPKGGGCENAAAGGPPNGAPADVVGGLTNDGCDGAGGLPGKGRAAGGPVAGPRITDGRAEYADGGPLPTCAAGGAACGVSPRGAPGGGAEAREICMFENGACKAAAPGPDPGGVLGFCAPNGGGGEDDDEGVMDRGEIGIWVVRGRRRSV